jgi:capsular polysaccharide biosynthesis protein
MISLLVNLLKKKILVRRRGGLVSKRKMIKTLRSWVASTLEKLGLKVNVVTSKELSNNSENYCVFQFGSEETIVVGEPHNNLSAEKLPWTIASAIGTFTLERPFVLEVANAELVGSTAVGFDQNGSIIKETVTGTTKSPLSSVPIITLISRKVPRLGTPELDTVYSLVNYWSDGGYFHWLIDALARLEGVEYYQQKTGRKPLLLLEPNSPQWKKESLRLLGYEPNDCIPWNGSRLKVKRLVVPSFRRGANGLVSPQACQWLRQRMLSNLPDVGSKGHSFSPRIYISRPPKAGRNVINEDEVLKALNPLGFVAYTMENMSNADQVRLFSQAEIVVAPHGAALTNIIFAPQNLIVIDIFGLYNNPCFLVIAKGLGFNYGCLGPVGSKERNRSEMYKGIIVDIPKLQALVTEMLDLYSDRQPASITY